MQAAAAMADPLATNLGQFAPPHEPFGVLGFSGGVVGAIVGAVLGSLVWYAIVAFTSFQIGFDPRTLVFWAFAVVVAGFIPLRSIRQASA